MRAALTPSSYALLKAAHQSLRRASEARASAEEIHHIATERYNALATRHGFAAGAALSFDDNLRVVGDDGDPALLR